MMQSSVIHHWQQGDAIVLRGVWRHKIWWAGSAVVAQDSPDLLALYWRPGFPNRTPIKRLKPRDMLSGEFSLIPRTWAETDVLMLYTPGEGRSVWAMWETGQTKLRHWYVDLHEPLRRTEIGFDTNDQLLDIVISADQSDWHWKDEDEFDEAVKLGVFSKDEARSIRAEGERVIQRLQTRQSPFCDGWEKWSPPKGWQTPELTEGLDRVW